MEKYKKLLLFIPYFENAKTSFVIWTKAESLGNGDFKLGYPKYDETFLQFIEEINHADLLKQDYLYYLDEKIKNRYYFMAINHADIDLLLAILTYYVRQERFCDGAWAAAIKEGIFLCILYRLRELVSFAS